MLVKTDDAVAGEMFVPGVTIKMSKTPAGSAPSRRPASTPTRSCRGSWATTVR
jgi:hypothetical protein